MADNNPLLVIDGVSATYNHAITALHGVSLTVDHGEIVALLGTNGAGKTTTLKAISNLLPASRGQITTGSIRFDGKNVPATAPADLVRSGLVQVLEGRHCFRNLTVEENLITGGIGRNARRHEISDDLEKIYDQFPGLKEKRRTLAGLTSGGEQQMTAIGRALMSRPRLLVLDEPSMGLAPLVVRDIFETLRKLNHDTGLAILVAEQNSTVALKYANKAVILENGKAVLSGTAERLRSGSDVTNLYLGQKSETSKTAHYFTAVGT
ncbi:ABC transporter ATP-binding protein [Phyllobacterium sp. YR531]|uniref:ABC transporter ATP-binding protein n=1 Tax=Phyllobacterium sp. YR531 TaxID=1144343 RepID=UPI00026F643D|nr:ABC transporter ATP-binding protein [Phyllobacterium sp. YR531]EJN02539.1 ABC-type branched-chain amino acid transport system, ATPase component [Phyllobacterium sp. YR531]